MATRSATRSTVVDVPVLTRSSERRASWRPRSLTRTGFLVGTPAYMAPEQFHNQAADARSDVFAYGVVMYEYACGTHPVRAKTPLTAPRPAGDVIARCMQESPAERFASAAEILAALDRGGAAETP